MAKCMLTRRIKIEQFVNDDVDDEGFTTSNWSKYYECWANYKTITGKEFIQAKAVQAENVVTFTVRYCNKVKALDTKNYRISFNNKTYNIIYLYDVKDEHNFVDIKCTCIE